MHALSTPRFEAGDVCHSLLACLIGLNIGDLITTRAVLGRGGVESNPVMRGIVDSALHASCVKSMFLVVVVALAMRTRLPGRVAWLLAVVNAWYVFVVGWNLTVLAHA